MPAPRKYPAELRERAVRLVSEARAEEPGLSLHQAVRCMHWFNTSRLHSALGHVPPVEYEAAYHAARSSAA